MEEITNKIREEARQLLETGEADLVIGYAQGWDESIAVPCFVEDESQVDGLIYDDRCTHNLALYLVGEEGYLTDHFKPPEQLPKVAIVAGPATLRTLLVLMQEHQFSRGDLIVLGISDGSPVGIEPDVMLGHIERDAEKREKVLAEIERIEDLPVSERWEWWERQLSTCIRCYACRQVCPFCYCEQCIADENQPQWIGRSPSPENNRMWNVIRAFHLVGRCTECGECDRVCPVGIPLTLLNTKMAEEVKKAFDYSAGESLESAPAMVTYQVGDPEGFIK
jgi:formate dehydrogenase subunit beta